MKLSNVTISSTDDTVKQECLFNLSALYPFAEWGILFSRKRIGTARYPSAYWLSVLNCLNNRHIIDGQPKINFSAHLCGAYAREFLMGDDICVQEIGKAWKMFDRVQINTIGASQPYHKIKLLKLLGKYEDKQFIIQVNSQNEGLVDYLMLNAGKNISLLYDCSGGNGKLPEEWPYPNENYKCGYAGGLTPDNIGQQLKVFEEMAPGKTSIWVDMESGIRSNDDRLFDLDKVQSVFKKCEKYAAIGGLV